MSTPRERSVAVGAGSIWLTETGDPTASTVLFLHGWPESSVAWREVTARASSQVHAVAVDLPGVGRSATTRTDGSTAAIADLLAGLARAEGWAPLTVVGHDLGGMIAYSWLRRHSDTVSRAVIMDVVVPGVPPWERVLANPYIWHFAFHAIPELPEDLVEGKQRRYFDWFFDQMSPAGKPDADARAAHARAYQSREQLSAGFDWYRKLGADATENAAHDGALDVPLLYLRGEHEQGSLEAYLDGFRQVGLADLSSAVIPGAGHFAPEDNPDAVWAAISAFLR